MSAFSALFASAKKVDTMSDLLLRSAGPVEGPLRTRTVLIEIDEPKAERESTESLEEVDSSEAKTPKDSDKIVAKKRKCQSSTDENDSLKRKRIYTLIADDDEPLKKAKKEKKEQSEDSKDGSNEQDVEKTKTRKKTDAARTIDLKVNELEKASRTVFVGNVSNNVVTSKSSYKKLKKLFSAIGPVESIRFRSIAFDEALPRKVAFVRKALHETRDTMNAYVVYKDKVASRKAPALLNATVFDDYHIRVDHVAHPSSKDNKRTIFVGNLNFQEQEETLWKYFNSKVDNDVEAVRIVRDAKTNFGKGFALVQFKDTLSVNKALLLNEKIMPASQEGKKGRKLRILRAKANAKPSSISPNHYENQKKTRKPMKQLNEYQETKLGRAKALLGKADRSSAGKMVVEGTRATKGLKIEGIKGLKSAQGRAKKPRITKRSLQFKKDRDKFRNLK